MFMMVCYSFAEPCAILSCFLPPPLPPLPPSFFPLVPFLPYPRTSSPPPVSPATFWVGWAWAVDSYYVCIMKIRLRRIRMMRVRMTMMIMMRDVKLLMALCLRIVGKLSFITCMMQWMTGDWVMRDWRMDEAWMFNRQPINYSLWSTWLPNYPSTKEGAMWKRRAIWNVLWNKDDVNRNIAISGFFQRCSILLTMFWSFGNESHWIYFASEVGCRHTFVQAYMVFRDSGVGALWCLPP